METNSLSLLGISGIGENDARFDQVSRRLGRKPTPNERQVAVRYAKAIVGPSMKDTLSRDQYLFWLKKDQVLTTDEANAFDNNAYELNDGMHFLRANIGTSGIQTLLLSSVMEKPGVCSFINQRVPNPFQITGIAVGFGEAVNATTNPAALKYQYDVDVPAEIQHGTLVFKQSSGEVFRIQLARLFQRNSATGGLGDHIFKLSAPKYFRTDSPITIELIHPDGLTVTPITASYFSYLNIELFGNELKVKAQSVR